MKHLLLLCLFSLLLVGCGDDADTIVGSTTSSDSTNAMSSSYATISAALDEFGNLKHSESAQLNSIPASSFKSQSFSDQWTSDNSTFMDERDSTDTSPKNWMAIQLDESAARTNGSKISMLGRFSSALEIYCALGILFEGDTDDDGYPANGSYDITFTADDVATLSASADDGGCGMSDVADMVGYTISMVVTDTTDDTTYDKKIVMTLPPEMDSGTQEFFMKNTPTNVNVATAEVNDNGIHRTVINIIVDESFMGEYVSGPDGTDVDLNEHIDAHRLFENYTDDEQYLASLSYNEKKPDDDNFIGYVLAAKPDVTAGKISLSMASTGLTEGDGTSYEACYVRASGTIDTDGSRCTASSSEINGIDVDDAKTNMFSNMFGDGSFQGDRYDSVTEGSALSFDSSTFATAGFSED